MRKPALTLTALGLMAALAVTAAAPAEAHGWYQRDGREHGWREHNHAGAAVALGLFSALAGAAIASSHGYAAPGPYYAAPYGYAGYGYYR